MSILLTPLKIRDITLKNRIVMSPMCQYSASDGYANEWHLVHLGSRAVGGTGLIIAEATAVSPEGRISPGDLGLWSDDHIGNLRRITDFIRQHDSVSGIQLAHAGRKASCALPRNGGHQLETSDGGWQTVAPSAIPFRDGERAPAELDAAGIKKIITDFRDAAKRALSAGFDIIEIHSAHGYLLHEFLSPLSNHRSDEYGGSFENRTRLLAEVVSAAREVWPSGRPLFVRISSTDWVEGGWSLEESVMLAGILKDLGADLIDCSSGGNLPEAQIPFSPGYQVPFAEEIRKSGIATGAVGLITTVEQAEQVLEKGQADLVLLGRELLRNPYFALKATSGTGTGVKWPDQYLRARQ